MGLVLRRDIGTKLTIADLDNNFQYLGMDSNDIDLHWSADHLDEVADELHFSSDGWRTKSFTASVYQLGVSIRNYDLIKNHNPELIIERFKKPKKIKLGEADFKYSPAKFNQVWPYNDYINSKTMEGINPEKVNYLRPMVIPVTASFSYYRIYAENYFSPVSPPKVSGAKNSFYSYSKANTRVYDDTNTYFKELPKHQKGNARCRISIRISDGLGGYLYSKPLVNFKIKMVCNIGYESVVINYDIL